MFHLFILLFTAVSCTGFAQQGISPKKLTASQVPASIRYKGKMFEAWQWRDTRGENILVTSTVAPFRQPSPGGDDGEETLTAELHAFHFVETGEGYMLLWKLSDAVKDCRFDITAAFIKSATRITDLDKDGLAETTVQYKLACRSDVSPAGMKIIMHEDSIKYALRGLMWVPSGPGDTFSVTELNVNLDKDKGKPQADEDPFYYFGKYQTENEFINAPEEFLVFARRQWLTYVKESFE